MSLALARAAKALTACDAAAAQALVKAAKACTAHNTAMALAPVRLLEQAPTVALALSLSRAAATRPTLEQLNSHSVALLWGWVGLNLRGNPALNRSHCKPLFYP